MNTLPRGLASLSVSALLAFTVLHAPASGNPKVTAHRTSHAATKAPVSPASLSHSDYLANLPAGEVHAWSPQRMPLRVYFIPPGPVLDGFSNDMFVTFRQACDEWSAVSNNRLSFAYTEDIGEADIVVRFSADRSNSTDVAEAGNARVLASVLGIDLVRIELFTRDSRGASYGAGSVFKGICLHELGHALGMVGHSPCPADIMAPAIPVDTGMPLSQVKLTRRDINTFNRIYDETHGVFVKSHEKALATLLQRGHGNVGATHKGSRSSSGLAAPSRQKKA